MDDFGCVARSAGTNRGMSITEAGKTSKLVVHIQTEVARLAFVAVLSLNILLTGTCSAVGDTLGNIVTATGLKTLAGSVER